MDGGLVGTRQPISAELLGNLQNLSDYAGDMAKRVEDKLRPVTAQLNTVAGMDKMIPIPEQEWPPLFSQMRICEQNIKKALDDIACALSRAEI